MITYDHYRHLKYFFVQFSHVINKEGYSILDQIEEAEKFNPEWKYKIIKEYLDIKLRDEKTVP